MPPSPLPKTSQLHSGATKVPTHHDRGNKPLGVLAPVVCKLRVRKSIKNIGYVQIGNIRDRIVCGCKRGRNTYRKNHGGGKTREEVDARYLAVYYLKYAGFYESDIARMLRITRQAVGAILRQFETRRKQSGKIFEITFIRVGNVLKTD